MSCNIDERIEKYMLMVENGEIRACEEQHLLVKHIRETFENEDIYTDTEQLTKYLALSKYFPYDKLFEWQEFVLGLHLCTFKRADGMPRWADLFCMIGRGAGKDGTIAIESMALTSPYNPIRGYDVDICANNEEQAMRPYKDLWEVFETPEYLKKMKKFYRWTRESAISLKNNSQIKGRTNSPKGKDGLRSGVVIFNEIHQYENYDNINVFTTGLGKKPHPRRSYFTTNGDVRGGPLDDILETSEGILRDGHPDNGLLPFICKLNAKDEVHDERNWEMANPSLPYMPSLVAEIRKEYAEWKLSPYRLPAFMTKRMNLPQSKTDCAVTSWANILSTNREMPDLTGWACTVGIDYAMVTDFVSVNAHFRRGDDRFDINHSWLCLNSADITRMKCPWKEWAENGLLTIVDDVEIHPDYVSAYIQQLAEKYQILRISLDNFRYALLADCLRSIGFDKKTYDNVYLVRPSDIMRVFPVIDSCFVNHNFTWGDNPVLRWATNNTKAVPVSGKVKQNAGVDCGNFTYGKIERKSRKTDPFMALVASMVIEEDLGCGEYDEMLESSEVFVW